MEREQIKELARMSADSYYHKCDDFRAYACNCDTNTEVTIYKRYGGYVVVFNGTDSASDWIDDLKYIPKEFAGLRVHKGFAENIMSVMRTVNNHVSELDSVIFTGHSKGGAEAELAAEYWLTKYCKRPSCVTFGAPAIFYDKHLNKTIRVVNEHDPVPRVGTRIGFKHGSKPYRIGRSPIYSGFLDILNPARSYVSSHSISEYIGNL
jgi:predicted lipase